MLMTNAHLNSHQYLRYGMLTSQKDGDDNDTAERNEIKTTSLDDVWLLEKRHPRHRIQRTVFSSITH